MTSTSLVLLTLAPSLALSTERLAEPHITAGVRRQRATAAGLGQGRRRRERQRWRPSARSARSFAGVAPADAATTARRSRAGSLDHADDDVMATPGRAVQAGEHWRELRDLLWRPSDASQSRSPRPIGTHRVASVGRGRTGPGPPGRGIRVRRRRGSAGCAANHAIGAGRLAEDRQEGHRRDTPSSIVDAIEVALCYGWIDGLRHKHDDVYFRQRFTPRRRPRSKWSMINRDRVEALIAAGPHATRRARRRSTRPRPTVGGTLPTPDQRTIEVPDDLTRALRRNAKARRAFEAA